MRRKTYQYPLVIGSRVPQSKSIILRLLGRAVAKALGGWKAVGEIPDEPKLIAVVGPHTSNWDYPVAMALVLASGLKISYFGKDTLFKPPFGFLFKALGGIPIKRNSSQGVVGQTADVYREREQLLLGIAPEGTRSRVTDLRSGFQQIAKEAEVPVLLVGLDYKHKEMVFSHTFIASDSLYEDKKIVVDFFDTCRPKNPELWGCISKSKDKTAKL